MDVSAGRKPPFLIENGADSPAVLGDELTTAATRGLPAGGPFRTIDARNASECYGLLGRALQAFSVRDGFDGLRQRLQQGLRAFVCRAQRMEPQSHFAFAKQVGKAFSEAQLAALDGLRTAAALGATTCGRNEEMSHWVPRLLALCEQPTQTATEGRRHEAVVQT